MSSENGTIGDPSTGANRNVYWKAYNRCAGLGKTTLAHVVAKHCGYRPVEINASDDRSAGALTSRIQNAAQMQSVVGDRRPNCIILDEIDGAAGVHTFSSEP